MASGGRTGDRVRIEDEGTRREFKRRLRHTREEKWNFSQEEMAREIRKHELDPDNPSYPGLRTYARWESETEAKDYLPPTLEKLQQIARVVGFDADDLLLPKSETGVPQFIAVRRLDEQIEAQWRTVTLLEEIKELLEKGKAPPA